MSLLVRMTGSQSESLYIHYHAWIPLRQPTSNVKILLKSIRGHDLFMCSSVS